MNEQPTIEKIALYGAPDRVTDALQDVLLERGLQVMAIVDDPTNIAARPGLAARSGTPFNADSVARSVAGVDTVIVVLNSSSLHIGGFERSYDAILALLEGLPTARVERLILIGEHGWLDSDAGLPAEKLEHLQHSLHKSPLAWTLVDAPVKEPNAFMTLQQYACSVIDQCLQGTSVKQRLHVDPRPQAEEAP
ncbi:NAD(P)H-binding protein [Pseudomonas sp. sia0905]|uniref:NAD(P)H-binding protein n=1 Tax=Pseudomonas sp. sia0905 TaxID=2854783 RepID=UPI001C46F914|nr:NAD(P)H-binding protein [Pseudomonas sp. sia0905]MBV7564718.1 NAD(P)H-binding protein [Pseudomonas sp. sia0905]